MSINTTITENQYVGNGATTNFPIGFQYTNADFIQSTVDGNIVPFAYDNALEPTTVIFSNPPGAGAIVLIKRVTPRVQNSEYNENQNFSDRAEAIEADFDKIVQMIQEIEAGGTVIIPTNADGSAIFEEWKISTEYVKNQLLRDGPSGLFYTVIDDFTSNAFTIEADITAGDLELFNRGEKGAKGDKGEKGLNGQNGAQGPQGIPGNDGVNGIFSQVATQAEAEAGVNNTKGMTPLRTKQAIDNQVAVIITATNLRQDLDALTSKVGELNSEIQNLESITTQTLGRYTGKQEIRLNQTVPLAIDADSDEGGRGAPLKFNSVGTEFVHLHAYIRRGDQSSTNFELVAQWINNQWYLSRKDTLLLNETLEFDGVTLTIETNGNEGQVKYISDPVAGTFAKEEHYISWFGQEIRQGVLL